MRVSRLIVFVVLALVGPIVGLTPLAYATPPDPSWICGMYDDADHDDVVHLVTSATGAAAPFTVPEFLLGLVAVGIPRHARACLPTATASTLHSRAPPA